MNLRGPKVRISRQLGIPLTPKAQKYLDRRPGTPGQHGLNQRPGKMSNYKRQLMEKQPIYAFEFEGKRHDAGDKLGFLKATVEFGLKNAEFGNEFRSYLKKMKL